MVAIFIRKSFFLYFIYFKLFFIDCAIKVVSVFSPLPPSTQYSPHSQAVPTPLFLFMGMHISSLATSFAILYFISPWLFCNYLFVLLNPLTSNPFLYIPLPSGNCQNAFHNSVSVLIVCLVSFLDSVVDRCVFIAILLFIV